MKRKIDPNTTRNSKKRKNGIPCTNGLNHQDDSRFFIPAFTNTFIASSLIGGGGEENLFQTELSEGLFGGEFDTLEEEVEKEEFRYGFTNSEIFAFIASLTPFEYLLFTSVLDITFFISLNVLEQQILSSLLVDLGVTLGNLVEQEAFQRAREAEITVREERNSFIRRQKALEDELLKLIKEVEELKKKQKSRRY